jgi:hypothetical protein
MTQSKLSLFTGIIIDNDYQKEGFSFIKVTENENHRIILFENGVRMYSYYKSGSSAYEKAYDTGVLDFVTEIELRMLIKVLCENHR